MANTRLISPQKDVYGKALYDYFIKQGIVDLDINTSYGDVEEMPAEVFFRDFDDFPILEAIAIENCIGSVLDVGAGVGDHSLILQDKGLHVTPIDISPYCIKVMEERGLENVKHADFFELTGQKFDTLLFLMNGLGLVGKLKNIPYFLNKCENLLKPGGKILFDSSDVSYLKDEFGIQTEPDEYIGEIAYQYTYLDKKGDWFNWLYLDKGLLQSFADAYSWQCDFLYEDENGQYLAKLKK